MNSAENFQIREQLVEYKSAENLQPSYMCKKSEFEDHFMVVSCMRLVDFCSSIFQPSLSAFIPHFIIGDLAGKYVIYAEICMG
jgi:hypothetical protein